MECVFYAPFRNDETPHDQTLIVSREQDRGGLVELAKRSKCIRTYSIDDGSTRCPNLRPGSD